MGIWNQNFKEVVPAGTKGNQSQRGIFYEDNRKRIRRLTSAEGHEIAKNPDTVETNPIGQASPATEVRGYNDTFTKDIMIKKDDDDYEFFNNWDENKPTGDNAKLRVYVVDFMKEEIGEIHNRYFATSYMATVTVDAANYTDGTLSVGFVQDGDSMKGIMQRTDSNISDSLVAITYGFIPTTQIAITEMKVSDEVIEIPVGGEARVAVSFSPLGCPFDFIPESSDPDIVTVKRWQQSVDITGLKAGAVTVILTSAADKNTKVLIEVKVGEVSEPLAEVTN